jgi:hypothetical protein
MGIFSYLIVRKCKKFNLLEGIGEGSAGGGGEREKAKGGKKELNEKMKK